jgi:hypothetical protein
MTDISKNVIKKIRRERLKPRPRRYYYFRKALIWAMFGLSTLLGIMAASVIVFQIKHADWDLYHLFDYTLLDYVVLMLPYFWFFFLLIFLGVASVYFRRTERGYRFHIAAIISGCLLISVIGGLLLYHTGFSEKLEILFQDKIPVYRTLIPGRHRMWQSPENGLLAGEITELVADRLIGIRDLQGNRWQIDTSNALWRGRLRPEIGLKIKLIGKVIGEKSFAASEIRPLIGRGYRRRFKTGGPLHSR